MGASNALKALHRWSGKVPGASMIVLTYMALVSKDKDDWPWYGNGQEAVAEFGLGRPNPDRTDLRAVQRALTPLLEVGAITVDRAGANRGDGNTVARYRLNIHESADEERRKWLETDAGKRRSFRAKPGPRETTVSGQERRRFLTQETTVSDARDARNRRAKETEETEDLEDQGISGSSETASHPSRAPAHSEPSNVVPIATKRTRRAEQTIAESTARREAARRASRATKEAT